MSRTPLAWRNLADQPTRTTVSIAGIAFAVLLMLMQLGFLGAVGDTATNVYRRLPGQLVVRSPDYLHVYDPRYLDQQILPVLSAMPEVQQVWPIDLGLSSWQNPRTRQYRGVALMGIDPDRPALRLPELQPLLPLLRRDDHILVDRTSRADFGPANGRRFGSADVGRTAVITGLRVRIAGTFEMGTGLAANGAVLTSREGFRRILPGGHEDRVSMVMIQLRPGIPIEQGRARLQRRLARLGGSLASARVLTAEQARWAERQHWYMETPIGMIFAMGVALAVIVGGVICYMVLAADVIAHLPEYATLKAVGYTDRFLGRTLLAQAWLLATAALPPAIGAALLLYAVTSQLAGVPIQMTWTRLLGVSLLSIAMCSAAGLLALRKLKRAEPANLF